MANAETITVSHRFETLSFNTRRLLRAASMFLVDGMGDDADELAMADTILDKAIDEFEHVVQAHWSEYQALRAEIRHLQAALAERAPEAA